MKWFNPPKTLEGLKKRGQLYLLTINIIVATANFLLLSSKFDQQQPQLTMICRPLNYEEILCQQVTLIEQ